MNPAHESLSADRGLWLYRAQQLEALLTPLGLLLEHLKPGHWLAPQTVLVGHPGMRQWLQHALAERNPKGIVANLDIVLPSPWLDTLSQQVLGEPLLGIRAWQRDVLRWRILPLLPRLNDPRVAQVLANDHTGREAFALAEALASALTPLMVYREPWLREWDANRAVLQDDALLRETWHALRERSGTRHRGERLVQLAKRLRTLPPQAHDDGPLHVFGLNHLPPLELDVLRALAAHRLVVFHVADPSREHWMGLPTGRQAMQDALDRDDRGEGEFLALDHPLLAGWGRLGQHFLLELERGDLDLEEKQGAQERTQREPETDSSALLQRLQRSFVRNDARVMREGAPSSGEAQRIDASLRIHGCATPLRELEVLHDALCDAFAHHPNLQPADVVVMSPQIERYASLIPAVFGEPGRRDGRWPYHLADVPLSATHALYHAVQRLLALPTQRLSAQSVLDLLDVPALAQRFGIGAGDRDALRHSLQRARVAWGLDGTDRARFGAPPSEEHTITWGLDRALAGHVLGQNHSAPFDLPDGTRLMPLGGVDSGAAQVLGRAHALMLELQEWAALATSERTAEAWSIALKRRLDAVFDAPALDTDSRDALETLKSLVADLLAEWTDAGVSGTLPWAAVRDALLARLSEVPERQRFLAGGITFCGMVPQRAIPFCMVAVLGLDEGALPRHALDSGLDLRRRKPLRGDRDLASDDRYLFLETVMAARWRLHLSHVAMGAHDGLPRNPAAPLADLHSALMRFALPEGCVPEKDELWPWQRKASLQPPALLAALARSTEHSERREEAPDDSSENAALLSTKGNGEPIDLEAVCHFYRDPARSTVQQDLGVRLDAFTDDSLGEHEPLLPRSDPRDAIAKSLIIDALERGTFTAQDEAPESWVLEGRLPPAGLGRALWRSECDKADAVLKAVGRASPEELPLPLPLPTLVSVQVSLSGCELHGQVAVREAHDGTLWLLDVAPNRDEKSLHFGVRVSGFLRWAALRLSTDRPIRVALVAKKGLAKLAQGINAQDEHFLQCHGTAHDANANGLRVQLKALLDFMDDVRAGKRLYLPSTSWAAVSDGHEDDEALIRAWAGGSHQSGERDYAPGYAFLLGRDWDLQPGSDSLNQFREDAAELLRRLPLELHSAQALEGEE